MFDGEKYTRGTMMEIFTFTIVRYLIRIALITTVLSVVVWRLLAGHHRLRNEVLTLIAAFACYSLFCIAWPFDFFGTVTRSVETRKKVIAVTFDDGPSARYTPQILEILRRHNARATFFVTGESAWRNPSIMRDIARARCSIGIHSWAHGFYYDMSTAEREKDIMSTAEVIVRTAGVKPAFFRAPYEYRDMRLMRLVDSFEYTYIGHDITSGDVTHKHPKIIAENVIKKAHPGAIVLMHDSRGNRTATVQALEIIISTLEKQGYRFVTIDTLIEIGKR